MSRTATSTAFVATGSTLWSSIPGVTSVCVRVGGTMVVVSSMGDLPPLDARGLRLSAAWTILMAVYH